MSTLTIKHHYPTGIMLTLVAAFMAAVGILIAKDAVGDLNISLMLLLRCAIPLFILLLISGVSLKIPKLNLRHIHWYTFRVLGFLLGNYCLFVYLKEGSLVNGTVLFLTSPMFVPLINRLVFGVHHHWKFYMSVVLAFVGVVVAVKPTSGIIDPFMALGLAGGFLNAISQIMLHRLSGLESTSQITFSSFFWGTLVMLVWTIAEWIWSPAQFVTTISFHDLIIALLLMVAFSFTSIINQSIRAKAYGYVRKAASLAPWLYTTIIFSAVLGAIFYHQIPDLRAVVGFTLIAFSAALTLIFK